MEVTVRLLKFLDPRVLLIASVPEMIVFPATVKRILLTSQIPLTTLKSPAILKRGVAPVAKKSPPYVFKFPVMV